MDIKRELKVESALRKIESGPNLLVFMCLAFTYLFSCIPCNIYIDNSNLRQLLWIFFLFIMLSMEAHMKPSVLVKEAGKEVSVFAKFRYAPTTPFRLFCAKERILVRFCLKHAIISQILQFLSFLLLKKAFNYQVHLMNLVPVGLFLIYFMFETLMLACYALKKY